MSHLCSVLAVLAGRSAVQQLCLILGLFSVQQFMLLVWLHLYGASEGVEKDRGIGIAIFGSLWPLTPVISTFPRSSITQLLEWRGHSTSQFYMGNCLDRAFVLSSGPQTQLTYDSSKAQIGLTLLFSRKLSEQMRNL